MLVVITQSGASLIDPASFKTSSTSFPISSSLECSTNVWSPDNTQLYLASGPSIKRYTPSECLLEELYCGSDTITCMEMKDKSKILFATSKKVWSLDCTQSPGKVVSSLEPHKSTVTMISSSNDGTLLASVSASAVFVHNLSLSSHAQLKGLPDRKPVACCLFHRHSRTRLLLGIGRDIVVYDSTRTFNPLKTIRIPGSGDIVGITSSPFSKTLVAAITSNGDVALVDLDKDNGILKTVNVNNSPTCCAFTAEGAAIYLGTDNGKLLILNLRSLEKEPKSFTIGDDGAPIKAINVQGKSSSCLTDNTSMKNRSNSTVAIKSPQRSASSRTISTCSVVAGLGAKSPARVTVASRIRGGGGVMPKKKLFSPARTPLSETKNLGLDARLVLPSSPTTDARQLTKPKMGPDVEHLGLGSAPESISGHLATMRVRSGPVPSDGPEDDRLKLTTRRVISESVETDSNGRKRRSTSSFFTQSKVSSSRAVDCKEQTQERRSTTPDNFDDLSSPELPCEPVTPISLGKKVTKAPLASTTGTGVGILGLTRPEVARWAKGGSTKGKEKENVVEVKKTRFAQHPNDEDSSGGCDAEHEGGLETHGKQNAEERKQELSLQVSPRRPTVPPAWLNSPHRPSSTNLNMNTAAQDFLRNIVHDVMYDFQRETKAEMMGLHLDLVRMGRGWKQELREIVEEWKGEIQELKAENKRLKEENERLRRGY